MVEDGFNGFVVPPGKPKLLAKAWEEARRRNGEWNHLGIRQRVVDRFSIQTCASSYERELTR